MAMDSPGRTARSTPLRISTGPARLVRVSETAARSITGLVTIPYELLPGLAPSFANFYFNIVM
jgi:hypothetical protein